jgi:hypothetical protein
VRPRLRWLLVAGCALVLGLEAPAALEALRGPAVRDARRAPGAPAANEFHGAGLEQPHG